MYKLFHVGQKNSLCNNAQPLGHCKPSLLWKQWGFVHSTVHQDRTAQALKKKNRHAGHTKHNSQLLWCWQQMRAENKLQWTTVVPCKWWEVQGWKKRGVWGLLECGRENRQQVAVSTECHLHLGPNLCFRRLFDTFLWSHEEPLLLEGAVHNEGVHRDVSSRVCCCKHFTK